MKYYISDLHLFHEASIRFDNRPFDSVQEMNETIARRWNRKVTNGDTVYILGDISMREKKDELIALVSCLKGRKVLIMGNHDDISDYRYAQLFDEICDYKEIHDSIKGKSYDLVLSHYPIFSWKGMNRGAILLYGHTHNSGEDKYYQECIAGMREHVCYHADAGKDIRAYNVGCMHLYMNYMPRSLEEIIGSSKE